jgi:ankyrin repeat protein
VRTLDKPAIRAVIATRVDVNAPEPDGTTPLHWAVNQDDPEIVDLLLRAGADAKSANRYGVTPLSLASTNGNATIIEMLLKAGADANTSLPEGETVLMTAARTGNVDAVNALLMHGANPNASETWHGGQTALMWAAAEGHAAVIRALVARGADVHVRTKSNFTPFLFAVREGKIPAALALIDAGVDVNETLLTVSRTPVPGPSALVLAVGNAHYELAAALLERGANPNAAAQGWTALHQITWTRRSGMGDNTPPPPGSGNMDALELVRKLVVHGANLNARITKSPRNPDFGQCGFQTLSCLLTDFNVMGATPFLMAARTADVPLMRLLADLGADTHLTNADNTTALLAAAGVGTRNAREDPGTESEVLEAVKLTLELGGDVNAVDKNGDTAFHGAAAKQAPSVVPFLAKSGADPKIWTQKNKNGWTALRVAEGIHRVNAFRSSPETAVELRKVMPAAGLSTEVEPEGIISGGTR